MGREGGVGDGCMVRGYDVEMERRRGTPAGGASGRCGGTRNYSESAVILERTAFLQDTVGTHSLSPPSNHRPPPGSPPSPLPLDPPTPVTHQSPPGVWGVDVQQVPTGPTSAPSPTPNPYAPKTPAHAARAFRVLHPIALPTLAVSPTRPKPPSPTKVLQVYGGRSNPLPF